MSVFREKQQQQKPTQYISKGRAATKNGQTIGRPSIQLLLHGRE